MIVIFMHYVHSTIYFKELILNYATIKLKFHLNLHVICLNSNKFHFLEIVLNEHNAVAENIYYALILCNMNNHYNFNRLDIF